MNKSIAGIVLYNPDLKRLAENVNAIASQVDEILFVDNHSLNLSNVKEMFTDGKYSYIENNENYGIAKALNQICYYASQKAYKWVLTLDQDSVVCDGLIEIYNKYVDHSIGLLTCKIIDRNFDSKEIVEPIPCIVKSAITSGSYVNISAWEKVGGFDEKMFIDFVDNDFCMTLIENHYRLFRIGSVSILHELGHSRRIKFLRGQIIYNHSAFRYYYLIRNRIYYARKHRHSDSLVRNILATLWRAFLILCFESHKLDNCKALSKGLVDGFTMDV